MKLLCFLSDEKRSKKSEKVDDKVKATLTSFRSTKESCRNDAYKVLEISALIRGKIVFCDSSFVKEDPGVNPIKLISS